VQSAVKLLDLAIIISLIMPLLACILMISNITDERLTEVSYMTSYMMAGTIAGVNATSLSDPVDRLRRLLRAPVLSSLYRFLWLSLSEVNKANDPVTRLHSRSHFHSLVGRNP
jgi:hypothetical protein